MRFQFVTIEGGKPGFSTSVDLPDPTHAAQEAALYLSEMVRDQADRMPHRNITVEVSDDEGRAVRRYSMIVE